MKRIRLLVLAGVIAAALPIGITAAGATGGSPPANYVEIRDQAQYDFQGTYIHVGLTVKCSGGGLPLVNVFVKQNYPETPFPGGAMGDGFTNVVCDGRTRAYAVTVPIGKFDAGRAYAEADLSPLVGSGASDKEWITIVHV
jgi:hypothetical protein